MEKKKKNRVKIKRYLKDLYKFKMMYHKWKKQWLTKKKLRIKSNNFNEIK
jgi:hypothetical protein